jgi:hypothetical protein
MLFAPLRNRSKEFDGTEEVTKPTVTMNARQAETLNSYEIDILAGLNWDFANPTSDLWYGQNCLQAVLP